MRKLARLLLVLPLLGGCSVGGASSEDSIMALALLALAAIGIERFPHDHTHHPA